MATTIAEPVVKLDMNNARFAKGVLSTKNLWRSMWRRINSITRVGAKRNNSAVIKSVSVAKLALGGFLSFTVISIFGKMLSVARSTFSKIGDAVLKGGSEMELAFVEVNKVVELSEQQGKKLQKAFLDFSDTAPVTVKQLLKIAAAGARMGLALDEAGNIVDNAVEKLTDFSKVVARADVAIEELDTEQLAAGLGQLLNLFKLNTDQTVNLASALNSAAQSANTTADQILNATKRSASIAKQFGLTVSEAIAINTTMLELGRTAEITGTSFERIFGIIARPNKFPKFAKLIGRTKEEFADLFDINPVEGVREIFSALGQFGNAREAEAVLIKLFGSQTRLLGSLRALSQGTKLLDKNLKVANREFLKGTSINKEFAAVAGTVAKRWEILSNVFSNVGKRIFTKIRPALNVAIDILKDFGAELNDFSKNRSFLNFIKFSIVFLSKLTASIGQFVKKTITLFIESFEEISGKSFLKSIVDSVDQLTNSLDKKSIKLFVLIFIAFLKLVKSAVKIFSNFSSAILLIVSNSKKMKVVMKAIETISKLIIQALLIISSIILNLFATGGLQKLAKAFNSFMNVVELRIKKIITGGLFPGINDQIKRAQERLIADLKALVPEKIIIKRRVKEKPKVGPPSKLEKITPVKTAKTRKQTIFIPDSELGKIKRALEERGIRAITAKRGIRRFGQPGLAGAISGEEGGRDLALAKRFAKAGIKGVNLGPGFSKKEKDLSELIRQSQSKEKKGASIIEREGILIVKTIEGTSEKIEKIAIKFTEVRIALENMEKRAERLKIATAGQMPRSTR